MNCKNNFKIKYKTRTDTIIYWLIDNNTLTHNDTVKSIPLWCFSTITLDFSVLKRNSVNFLEYKDSSHTFFTVLSFLVIKIIQQNKELKYCVTLRV